MRKEKLIEQLKAMPKNQKLDDQTKQKITLALKKEIAKENHREKAKPKWGILKKMSFAMVNVAVLAIVMTLFVQEVDFGLEENTSPSDVVSPVNPEPSVAEDQQEAEEENEGVPEPNILQVLDQYKMTFWEVVEDRDADARLQSYQTKEEVTAHFNQVMSKELATWYTDTYIKEENGELYVRAIDGPIFFNPDEPYEKEKINNKEYKITQEPENELVGEISMSYILVYDGDRWIVEGLQSEEI